MKWRSLLLVLFATTSVFLSSFGTPEHALAQTADTYTYDYFFNNTTSFFDNTINGVTSVCNTYKSSPDYKPACDAILPLLNSSKSSYVNSFNADKSQGTKAADAQVAAIGASKNTYSSARPTPLILGKAPSVNAIIQSFEAQLNNFRDEATSVATNGTNTSGAIPNASAPTTAAETANKIAAEKCSFSFVKGFSLIDCADVFVSWIIKNTLLQFAGFLLWATANLLDFVIKVGILDFSKWAPEGLYFLWQTVRQIVTMFVVFSGLYLGFMYIINKGDEFKRYVPWIVIFGLFVNFSYPITKAAIDVSNIVSLNIYASALNTTSTLAGTNTLGNSAGAQIMTSLGLQGLVMSATSDQTQGGAADLKNSINSTPAALLVVGYVVYAAYIFFIASGILMLRTLALSFIIIASPILFVDAVIPKLGEQAQKLRKIFFEQLSVSIVFMIMLYLSIAMTKVFKNLGGGGVTGTSITQIFNVLMMLALLHIMLKVTKAVSGSIGQMAGDAMGKFGGFAGGAALGLATGGAGLLARSTIGAKSASWAQSETEKAQRGESSAHDSWLGRKQLALSTSLAGSSFNLGNTKLVGDLAGRMGGSGGLGFANRFKVNSYNDAKSAYEKETMETAKVLQGDKREEFLKKRTGGDDVRNNLVKEDNEMMQKYAGASDDVRETMLADKNNTKYKKRFEEIDKFLIAEANDPDAKNFFDNQDQAMKDILKKQALAKKSKKTNKEINDAKEFLAAKPEEIEMLETYATEDQKILYEAIQNYKAITGVTAEDIEKKASILASIENKEVAKTILNSDEPYRNTKENIALQDKIQLAYNNIPPKGGVSSGETIPVRTTQTASQTPQVTVNVNQTVEAPQIIDPVLQSISGDLSDFLKGKEVSRQVAQTGERPVINPQEPKSTPA